MDCTSVNYYVFWWKKNALYKHQKLKDYCVKPLGSSFRTYCSWWLAEPCLVHGRVSLALGPCTVRAATHVIFIMFICGLPVQADLCWLVPPDSISSPHFWRHVCKHRVGLWSERVDALQTGSHTRCLCTKRKKNAEKKHFFFLCIPIVHSDPPSCLFISPSHLRLKSVSLLLCRLRSHRQRENTFMQRQADTTCSFRCHQRSPSLGEWN